MNTKSLKTEVESHVKETVQNARQDTDRLRHQMQISHETLDKSFNDLVVHIEGSVDEKMDSSHNFVRKEIHHNNKMKSYKHNNDITRRNDGDNSWKTSRDEMKQRLYDVQLQQL